MANEQQIIDLTRNVEQAKMAMQASSLANVFGKTPEELARITVAARKAEDAYWLAVKRLEQAMEA